MLYVDLDRGEDKVKLTSDMQKELSTGLAYYSNFLKAEIYKETDPVRTKQLRERLFTTTKLYYIFEQETIRVRTGSEFFHNWEKISREMVANKLKFG